MTLPHANAGTRRDFIKQVGALGAAAALTRTSPAVFAQDKSGSGPLLVGTGEHTYEVQHDWAQTPSHITFGNTHGVCEDSQGFIYIKHTLGAGSQSDDAICVFDPDGNFVRSWGAEYKGGAHGLHIAKEGAEEFLYLCDFAHHWVVKTNLRGEVVWKLSNPAESGLYSSDEDFRPTNVATAPNGDVYVGDGYGKSWIHRFTSAGAYLGSFGGPGAERGQLSCPHGLMVDLRGEVPELVVADRSNRRLSIFSLEGRFLRFVTDELRSPCHFHTHGKAMVIPDLEARVTIFDENNRLIAHLGDGGNYGLRDKARSEFIPGKFIAPHGAIFDRSGNIFVVEWVEIGRVTKLRRV